MLNKMLGPSYLRNILILFALLLSVGYVSLSYYQISKINDAQTTALFLEEKKEITEALRGFQKFISLTEGRLINSIDKKDKIHSILSFRSGQLLSKKFPDILSLTFSPSSDPTVVYSRFGTTLNSQNNDSQKKNEGFSYTGNGVFQLNKTIYNQNNQKIGTLQSTISIAHLLYKHFSKYEIEVLPSGAELKGGNPQSFTVDDIPYEFVLNKPGLSFVEFLESFQFQIITSFLLCIVGILAGITSGIAFSHKKLIKYRFQIQKQKNELYLMEDQKRDLTQQVTFVRQLLKLKDKSKEYSEFLIASLQNRYRQMAGQAQAISELTSRLIKDETGNNKLMKDIYSISQESNSVLNRLKNGFPMRGFADEIDIAECINNVRSIFFPEMMELNTKFEVKGKIINSPKLDQAVFEIVLHNIFRIIIERLSPDNTFKIELKDGDPLQITFYDNGFDPEDKFQFAENSDVENIMSLSKNRLREFLAHLDWKIEFQKESELLNSITLSIPKARVERKLPDNVINMFDFGSHAS